MDFSRLADFKSAGINRLSIGLQSLRDNHLKMMGRDHSATEARDATLTAAKLFPNRFTADLIYGIPGQSLKEWRHDLFEITTQLDSPAHLSLYQLILERGTPLHRSIFRDKTLTLPDEEVLADMWEATVEIAHSNNYQQYEVSSFALNGLKENKSVHNQGYWSGHDFIGVGPGAHGRITSVKSSRFRTFRILDPNQWMAKCESSGSGMRKTVEMTRSEIMAVSMCGEIFIFESN